MSSESAPVKSVRQVSLPFLSAVAIALGLAGSTFIAAGTWKEVRKKPEKNNIRITGSARKRIVSDLIQWSALVEAQGADRTAAYVALKGGTEKVVAFLKAQGVKAEEIQTESASITEEFDIIKEDKVLPGTNVPLRSERKESKGFKAKQVVTISSTNIPQIEKASREITTLLEQGVDVTSHDPNYYYTRLGELKLEMLAEAAKDARARAENILSSAGNTGVGKLVYADMGIININAANSTETSNEGNNDTTSRDKDIITIVHAEYEVK
ncbi:SIMPL domain-containing protein [Luteolibacter ambystomatis]|uniref:SIMPL domain-containing protein n=1 Tax=Luteolibacter ambystomatis TaxID=2824561 RepID=A0A975G9A9_9BACT|nr:SIMPL domain-containing protein [Luteolibacter ambystomatis]QUE51363.1 SIMPL domain-containing protein [Luteolibacter ambystomatis]